MEEKVHVRPSLGSRLPKFGGIKSGESLLQSVANGTPVGVLVTSNSSNGRGCIKQNGTAPTSSTSESWRKQNSHPTNDHNAVGSATLSCNQTERLASHKKYLRPDGGGGKDALKLGLKNSSSLTSKTEHPANMFVSTTEELNQKPLTGLSHSAKFTKGTFLGRTSYSGLHAPKPQVNGFFTNRPTVGLHRPRANSATARISLKEGLAQATDSMKSLSCDRMIRSQSFSHSIQNSLLPTATLTRSHSFNRAVDLTKPYQNQHATIRAFQRSNLLSRSTRQSEIPSGTEPHLKYNFSRTAMPVSVLKKPSLTNGPELASPLEYQMNRPSLLKPNRSQFASKIIVDGAKTSSVDSCILEKAEPSQSDKGRATDEQKALMEKSHQVAGHRLGDSLETLDSKGQYFSDDVDEISISSLSSSDKNDLSEDFSDDFLDLDDPNITVIKVKTEEHPPQSTMEKAQSSPLRDAPVSQCKTEDWINMSISAVQDKSQSSENTYEIVPVSPDMDYREGSSLELSPSDSSDGTYMWDEEGLEPIGSVHPCGSYESSEMNSIDVLNNLDSCDIEDDDLMLDVDLPEDTPSAGVEAENMNLFERPERNIRQPQQQVFWKRSQQRRNGQEHYHLSSTDHFHHSRELNRRNAYLDSHTGLVENYGPSNLFQAPRAAQMMGLHENIVMLDEMTLRHMVQDCTQVKTQLLKLKRLLQSEDTESLQDLELSTPVTPEPNEAETTLKDANCGELDRDLDSQKCEAFPNNSAPLPPKVSNSSFRTDDLLNEIRQLKAEAKIKDERIKQLEHQLATRCNCCKEGQEPKREHRLHCEKYTQTPWRKVSPQILQRSSSTPSPTDHSQGRLARPSLIEGLSEYQDEPVYKNVNHLSQNVGNYSEPIDSDPGELSDLLSAQLQINDFAENGPTTECLQTENKLPVCRQQTLNDLSQPHTHPSFRKTSSQVETRTELHTKLAVKTCKKSSLGKNSRPKTLQLAMPKKEFAVVHHAEEPTERSQNKSQTCDEPQLQTMDDLLSELPVTCDVPSDLQSTCSSPSHFPPTDTSPLQLQPTNPGVLQLHVTVASPSQLHFTVTNPSQLWPSNASLSHMPVNHLVESQLASASPQDPPADSPSQLELPGDAALLHSKADTQYDLHSRSDRLSQPSSSDSTVLQPNAASLSDLEPQVQDVSSVKSPAAIPSPLKLPSTSQSNLKSQAGSQTTLKSPSACLMTKSPVIDPMSSKSSTASPAALKSPASSPLMMKLPATKPSVKNLAAASASVQRLPAGAALPLKQHTASPSKQPPPEAVLLQVKPPSVNPAQLQPSATNLAISASKQSSANSKLRPPSIFLSKSRQVNNPEKPSMLVFHDPLKSSSKTTVSNIPRPLTQKKDTHHGDSTNSSRLSRLPKPKTQ